MLGIFSGKSDHPLADAKGARELFDRLSHTDPLEAIEEIDSWLESASDDDQIKPQRRVEVLFRLDDIGTTAARKLGHEYLLLTGSGQGQNYKLWQANRKYWQRLAASYRTVIGQFEADKKMLEEMRATMPALQVRLLRAYAGCLKWDQFRYGPIDPDLWLGAGRVYLQAEKGRWLGKKQAIGADTQTTVEAEYLRLLLFHAASMDRLQPMEIELAELLLQYFLPEFSLTAQVRPENVYWADAGKALPPTRLAKLPEITPSLRFFATANALTAIESMRSEISATQTVPRELGIKQQFPVAAVIAILSHLAAFCAPQPPMRSHARHQVKSWMRVASGFQATVAALLRGGEFDGGSWAVEDVSRGGLRAQVALTRDEELVVGSLVGVCPDGGNNWLIGIVRRISRETQTVGNVGIETVGRSPCAVRFDSNGLQGDGLLLDSALNAGGAALVVVSTDVWRDFRPLGFEHQGNSYRLRPLEQQQSGGDYVIGRYWADTLPA